MKDVPPHLREKKYLEESLAKLLEEQKECKRDIARLAVLIEERKRKRANETDLEC